MPTIDKPKILVVNDDAASLLALSSLLDQWADETGYTVMSARSGQEALRQVLLHDFAVIILDVNMPGMDGFETAEAIHQRARSADIPIIFVTAFLADEIDRLKAYQRGAADFLFTPVIPQILHAKVSVFVALANKNEQLRHQTEKLSQRTLELTGTNERLMREIEERQAAEAKSHAKDEFLAMLGHELRNPLSAISSAAALIDMPGAHAEMAQPGAPDHPAPDPAPVAHRRRPARPVARDVGQDSAGAQTGRHGQPGRRLPRHLPRHRPHRRLPHQCRPGAELGRRRSDPPRTDCDQPDRQCAEIHAGRRHDRHHDRDATPTTFS